MMRQYPFQVRPLSYSYVSFAPYCDPDTLYLHHDRYYRGQVQELNRLVVQHRLEEWSLERLLTDKLQLPVVQADQLRSAAGAVYAHELYFDSTRREMDPPPANRLTGALTAAYGSMQQFKRLLQEAAASLPGSGWIWLVAEGGNGLHIIVTRDNETPPLYAVRPLLVIDLWEHAYFLDYQFDLERYLDVWFSFIDWEKADARLPRSAR